MLVADAATSHQASKHVSVWIRFVEISLLPIVIVAKTLGGRHHQRHSTCQQSTTLGLGKGQWPPFPGRVWHAGPLLATSKVVLAKRL